MTASFPQSGALGTNGRLIVDLGALRRNYAALCDMAAPARTAAVVKADAYGLGADRVAPALYQAGCRDFFVAVFGEALDLRPHLPEDARLYVLNGLNPGEEDACADAAITPVLNHTAQIEAWSACARRRGKRLAALVQIDTGMSRLGLTPDELAALTATPHLLDGIEVTHVMSHYASADDPLSEQTREQYERMTAARVLFEGAAVSFSNSPALVGGRLGHFDLARPGIALYGGSQRAADDGPLNRVIELSVRVIQTRDIPAGALVGYGGTFRSAKPMRLATVGAGYADGLRRHLSGKGAVYHDGIRLPITGRVSMDSIIVDISALEPEALRPGDFVEIIGPHQTPEDLAGDAGTIAYEILTSLGRRYQRLYVDNSDQPESTSS